MTRIIAGSFRGRRLVTPADARVRPTADRVREAWFSIIADRIPGASVLDLFAGSGGLGLEALSRGARSATFVEISRASLAAIDTNVAALGVADRATVLRRDALRYAATLPAGAFDVAFADPPYGFDATARLVERYLTVPFASLFAVEHLAAQPIAGGGDTRRYGDTAITFFDSARGL